MAGYFSGTVDVGATIKIPGHSYWHGGTFSVNGDTSVNVVTIALGTHQSGFVKFMFGSTDWCCHSGGSGYVECHLAAGYGAPGTIVTESVLPGQWQDLDFFAYNHSGSTTRSLRVTNGSSSNSPTMQCQAWVQSSGGGVSYAF